jgi:hypothetical protein
MSLLAICCLAIGAVGLFKLGWAALKPLPEEMHAGRGARMEDLLALHAQHFPQLRQALATLDDAYVRRKASGEIERHLRAERRPIVESFLAGLAEDFGRLEHLMKEVQDFSPAGPWIHQIRRAIARFQFRVNYRLASLQIHSARPSATNRLARLTELVGNLSVQIEASMARLVASPTEQSSQIGQSSQIDPE